MKNTNMKTIEAMMQTIIDTQNAILEAQKGFETRLAKLENAAITPAPVKKSPAKKKAAAPKEQKPATAKKSPAKQKAAEKKSTTPTQSEWYTQHYAEKIGTPKHHGIYDATIQTRYANRIACGKSRDEVINDLLRHYTKFSKAELEKICH